MDSDGSDAGASLDTNRAKRFSWRERMVSAGFFLIAFVLYPGFRSQMAYRWDGAEFALAIRDYNVALSQPHAPGYFLYVMLGRLVNSWVGDPHASLVWISVAAGGIVAALMYLLGTAMFGNRAGVAAGLFALTSPQVWFHSCVALTYLVDAALVCLVVFCCWRAMDRGGRWRDAILIGIVLAVVGGVRQQTAPALVPLVLYAFWRFEKPRGLKLLVAAGVTALVGAAWFAPMVAMSGGLPLYLEIVRRHAAFNACDTWVGGGTGALLKNIVLSVEFCWNGLGLGLVALAVALFYRVQRRGDVRRKEARDAEQTRAVQMVALWICPMVLLGTVVGFTKQPGYVLCYLPGLLLLAAVAVARLKSATMFSGVIAIACAANVAAFLALPQTWNNVLFCGLGLTARQIRQHDEQLASAVQAIRNTCKPSETIICQKGMFLDFGLRLFQLYLPEFEQYQLPHDPTMVTPPGNPMLSVRGGRLQFVRDVGWDGKRVALLIVPPGLAPAIFAPVFNLENLRPVPGSAGIVYALPVKDRLRS